MNHPRLILFKTVLLSMITLVSMQTFAQQTVPENHPGCPMLDFSGKDEDNLLCGYDVAKLANRDNRRLTVEIKAHVEYGDLTEFPNTKVSFSDSQCLPSSASSEQSRLGAVIECGGGANLRMVGRVVNVYGKGANKKYLYRFWQQQWDPKSSFEPTCLYVTSMTTMSNCRFKGAAQQQLVPKEPQYTTITGR